MDGTMKNLFCREWEARSEGREDVDSESVPSNTEEDGATERSDYGG